MLLIVVGPSGVGKSTLCNELVARFDEVEMSVSYTTRAPRGRERDGVHYWFVSGEVFEEMAKRGAFAEHAQVHGNAYGTTKATIAAAEAAGKTVLFDIDYQGALQLKRVYPDAVSVMVMPPSMQELEVRLRGRGTDTDEVIAARLGKAKMEMSHYQSFDHIVFNQELEKASAELRSIYRASHTQMHRNRDKVEQLLHGY